MPFGQRSLTPDSGVALRANFLAMDNDLKIISRRHSDDQRARSPCIRHSTQFLVRPIVKEQRCEMRNIGFQDLADENRVCTELKMLNDCTFKVRGYAVDDGTSV